MGMKVRHFKTGSKELYKETIRGICIECNTKVDLTTKSSNTMYVNGDRFHLPDDLSECYCLFRCRGCEGVVGDNWEAL